MRGLMPEARKPLRPASGVLSRATTLDELEQIAREGRLYAVIDACDMPAVPEKAREVGATRAVSLYRGTADEMYWAFAPYLFAVDVELLDWIIVKLWSEPWGIFAVADADLQTVRRHFRRFLLVQAPNGEQWYFRFYDPRVLTTFLPTCSDRQIAELFTGVSGYVCQESNGDLMLLRPTGESRRRRMHIKLNVPGAF